MEIDEFVQRYPTVYHMAESGSWENIQAHGLLSTSGLLDLYGITGSKRVEIEKRHRPECIEISRKGLPNATIRDQKPMSDVALSKVLTGGLNPADWYQILNSKVFFWSTYGNVLGLLNARAYRDLEHDVIHVDTRKLVDLYEDKILLSPYNSGSTIMKPVQRGIDLFQPIENHDFGLWKKKRGANKAVTEVCVEGGVTRINEIVIQVQRMQSTTVKSDLFP